MRLRFSGQVVNGSISLVGFLKVLFTFGCKDLSLRQVLFQIARRVDSQCTRGSDEIFDSFTHEVADLTTTKTGLQQAISLNTIAGKARIRAAYEETKMVSTTCDESNVKGLKLYSTAIIGTDNTGCWAPPQIVAAGSGWRPKKKHRVGARNWLLHLDSQLQVDGLPLKEFQTDEEQEKTLDPYEGPLLSISPDRGPTGVAALKWMVGPGRLNVDISYYDFNHGSWDDEKAMIKELGDHSWLLMMLVDINVMEGPWESCSRFAEAVSALPRLHRREVPQRVPLFMEFASNIMQEAGLNPSDEAALEAAWAQVGDAGCLRHRGYRCNLNRLHGFTERDEHEVRCWWARLFQYLYVSVEPDYLGSKSSPKLRMPMTRESLYVAANGANVGSMSSVQVSVEEKVCG